MCGLLVMYLVACKPAVPSREWRSGTSEPTLEFDFLLY